MKKLTTEAAIRQIQKWEEEQHPRGEGGRFGSGGGSESKPGKGSEGERFTSGARVRIVGEVRGKGKSGYISESAPSGKYHAVVDENEKHLGYFHESDLKPMRSKR